MSFSRLFVLGTQFVFWCVMTNLGQLCFLIDFDFGRFYKCLKKKVAKKWGGGVAFLLTLNLCPDIRAIPVNWPPPPCFRRRRKKFLDFPSKKRFFFYREIENQLTDPPPYFFKKSSEGGGQLTGIALMISLARNFVRWICLLVFEKKIFSKKKCFFSFFPQKIFLTKLDTKNILKIFLH